MKKIERVSKIIRILAQVVFCFTIFAILVLTALTVFISEENHENIYLKVQGQEFLVEQFGFQARVLFLLVIFLWGLVFEKGVYQVIQLFKLYEKGKIFLSENVLRIKELGKVLILWSFVKLISDWGTVELVQLTSPSNTSSFSLSLDFTALVVGILIMVVAWVMDEGRKLREEAELTI